MGEVMITRLSSKGQIVLPKTLRDKLNLKSGELFAMFGEDGTIILKKLDLPSEESFEKLLKWGEDIAENIKISDLKGKFNKMSTKGIREEVDRLD